MCDSASSLLAKPVSYKTVLGSVLHVYGKVLDMTYMIQKDMTCFKQSPQSGHEYKGQGHFATK